MTDEEQDVEDDEKDEHLESLKEAHADIFADLGEVMPVEEKEYVPPEMPETSEPHVTDEDEPVEAGIELPAQTEMPEHSQFEPRDEVEFADREDVERDTPELPALREEHERIFRDIPRQSIKIHRPADMPAPREHEQREQSMPAQRDQREHREQSMPESRAPRVTDPRDVSVHDEVENTDSPVTVDGDVIAEDSPLELEEEHAIEFDNIEVLEDDHSQVFSEFERAVPRKSTDIRPQTEGKGGMEEVVALLSQIHTALTTPQRDQIQTQDLPDAFTGPSSVPSEPTTSFTETMISDRMAEAQARLEEFTDRLTEELESFSATIADQTNRIEQLELTQYRRRL